MPDSALSKSKEFVWLMNSLILFGVGQEEPVPTSFRPNSFTLLTKTILNKSCSSQSDFRQAELADSMTALVQGCSSSSFRH